MSRSVHVHCKTDFKVILAVVCSVVLIVLSTVAAFAADYINVMNSTGAPLTLNGTSFTHGDGAIMYSSPVYTYVNSGTVLIQITGYTGFSNPLGFEQNTEIIYSPTEYNGNYNNVYTYVIYNEYDSDRNFRVNFYEDCTITVLSKVSNDRVFSTNETYLTWEQAYNAGANYYKALYEQALQSSSVVDVEEFRGAFRDGINGLTTVWVAILNISVLGVPLVSIMAAFALVGIIFALVKIIKK